MKTTLKLTLITIALAAWTTTVQAKYTETMDPNGPSKNLKTDYGLVDDNAKSNQSETFQKAIDDLTAAGGGRLIVPKGTYQLAGVRLKSNVHLLIEKDTVIKPFWPEGTKAVVFLMDAERPRNKATEEQEKAFIENVSIRGHGGRFSVDYSGRKYRKGKGIRAVLGKMVRNFLIENMDVKDSFTTYCGITLTPTNSRTKDVSDWEVTRSTDGTVRNCRIFNASPGYGLTQLHGAQSVHFEDIYADGGVALRLETGAVGLHTGVFDITAKNVTCENGRCAVMFGPHSAKNGLVQVENVTTKSCTYAVSIGLGGVKDGQLKIEPDATNGIFADGTCVKNVHAVFGKTAQVKTHAMMFIPEEYHDELKLRWFNKFFEGPSIGAVKDMSGDHFKVRVENVTMEGFKYNADKPILTAEDERPGKWGQALQKWKADRGIADGK